VAADGLSGGLRSKIVQVDPANGLTGVFRHAVPI